MIIDCDEVQTSWKDQSTADLRHMASTWVARPWRAAASSGTVSPWWTRGHQDLRGEAKEMNSVRLDVLLRLISESGRDLGMGQYLQIHF